MIPTQNNDHDYVTIDMCTVVQVNDREVTRDSWLQLWLSVAWIIWAWACDLVQRVIRWSRRHAVVASADQDKPIFDAIPGYLAAARGFARLTSATLMPPEASQPSTLESTFPHPDVSRSMSNDVVAMQSRHNRRQRRVRRCRKLSLGSVDSGIDMTLDATTGLRTSTDDDMRVGKVTPTLTMGHGRLPAQALAELATPGAQFVQHMAPVPVLVRQPGDPPLGN